MGQEPHAGRRRQTPPQKATPDKHGQVTQVRYSIAVATKICARLAKGESWSRIANTKGMPCYSALYAWQKRHPEFAEAVAQAREIGADYCADKALEVAAAATKDTVQQDRLFVQTLMKHAALKAPKRWGGKGEAKEKPQKVEMVFRVRHFEKVIGPDGKAFVREILPEGEA
jgi:hypothetical protein